MDLKHVNFRTFDVLTEWESHPEQVPKVVELAILLPKGVEPPHHDDIKWRRITYLPMEEIAWFGLISCMKDYKTLMEAVRFMDNIPEVSEIYGLSASRMGYACGCEC